MAAIIAAGGLGSRFSGSKPKQRNLLGGVPIYQWSLARFLEHSAIDAVVVVSHVTILGELEKEIEEIMKSSKLYKLSLVAGGQTRQESVYLGLKHLQSLNQVPEYVLVHDAARPFVDNSMIDRTIQAVKSDNACTVGLPVADTIKRVKNGLVTETLDRSELYAVHTPQAAKLDLLLTAHECARRDGVSVTDDAALLELNGSEVKIIPSHRYNIKITVPEDLALCESISHMFIGQINECPS